MLSNFQLVSVEYSRNLEISNLADMPAHGGRAFLLCDFNPETEAMVAREWCKDFPRVSRKEIVVVFCERQF